jgi:hypothetical protein
LLQVARQPTDEEMRDFVLKIGAAGVTRDQARDIRQGKPQKLRNFTYQYDSPNHDWSLTLKFRNPETTSDELKKALKETLESID